MLMHITKHDFHAVLDAMAGVTVAAVMGEEITDTQTEDTAADTVTDEEIRKARNAYYREYARTHRDIMRAIQRRYYAKHREKVLASHKKWRDANRDKVRESERRRWKRLALELRQQSPPITTDDQLRHIVNDKRQQLKNSDNAED